MNKACMWMALVVVAGMTHVAVGQLTTNNWLGTQNEFWGDPNNWSLGAVPDADTVAVFDDPDAPNRTITVDQDTAAHQIHFLRP